jgi:ATP-binding cassette, subfamily B, bacterial
MTVIPEADGRVWSIVRRGMRLSPAFTKGLTVTVALQVAAMAGRTTVPVAIQQIIDRGFGYAGSARLAEVTVFTAVTAAGIVLTGLAAYLATVRASRAAEAGLADTRVRAYQHVLRLPDLTQRQERRGALVARVTADIDTISSFVTEVSGAGHAVSLLQLAAVSTVMAVYSWQLTLVVWACFVPLALLLRAMQPSIARRFLAVRRHIGNLASTVAESVAGAVTIRAFGYQRAMNERVGHAVSQVLDTQIAAQRLTTGVLAVGEIVPGIANMAVILIGVQLGLAGNLSFGELIAFLFLTAYFVSPIQAAVELLNQTQSAVACWRRVLGLIELGSAAAGPDGSGVDTARRAPHIRFDHVDFRYPGSDLVLVGADLTIAAGTRIAIVGQTGSGKSTFAKLLTCVLEPTAGEIRLDGVPLNRIQVDNLRRRVVMVPQDGYLFDDTIAANIRLGRPEADGDQITTALAELGLAEWVADLPRGLGTMVGERGHALSAGERQLVGLARAHIASPDLLVLDEATSAVDTATETRIRTALDTLTRDRTAVFVAHRMSTAEAADEVLVFDSGRIVERGHHTDLLAHGGTYAALHAAWLSGAH